MSGSGHLQTFGESKRMSGLPPEADTASTKIQVSRGASNEAQRQFAFDIEVTSQRAVPELTGSSANNLN
jgi:hypothetical protein